MNVLSNMFGGPKADLTELQKKIDQAKATYEKDGIAIIPGVFTYDEVSKLRAAALIALTELDKITQSGYPHKVLQSRNVNGQDFPGLLFFPALGSEYLNEIRTDERMAKIVSEFLGNDVKQLNNQVYYRLPGDGDSFAWHQDVYFRQPRENYPGIEGSYLQTIVAVDELTEDNGAVEFIPGSHKVGELDLIKGILPSKVLRNFKRGEKAGIKYLAKPGDVMIWSVMTVHGSEPNLSNRHRMTYMNGFAKADAAKDWPYYIQNGKVIKKLDPSFIPS